MFGMDLAAVEVDDPARDGEAEPGAAFSRGACRVGPVEALEDPCALGVGDARPLVEDLDGHALRVAPGAHLDGPAAGGEANRVLEEVGDDLVDPFRVAVGGEVGGIDLDRDVDGGLLQALLTYRVLEERLDGERGPLERHDPGLETREV